MIKQLTSALFLALIAFAPNTLALSPTAFTYQGQLKDAAAPANGTYDLTLSLFDAATAGNQIGTTLTNAAVNVSNGLFTTTLDFGSLAFSNSVRYLEISVRTNTSSGAFTTLAPRQSITPAPTAIYAAQATSLNSPLPDAQLSANIPRLSAGTNTFNGQLVSSSAIIGSGNTLANSGPGAANGLFAGLQNSLAGQPFDSAVIAGAYNTITGTNTYSSSTIMGTYRGLLSDASYSSTIGGAFNTNFNSQFSIMLAGYQNNLIGSYEAGMLAGYLNILNRSSYGVTLGGLQNTVDSGGASAIIGGSQNTISNANSVVIIGGNLNFVTNASFSTIVGGTQNAFSNANYSTVIGGTLNGISNDTYSIILGGHNNAITNTASSSIIAGSANRIGVNSPNSSILAGDGNTISNSSQSAVIAGEANNLSSLSYSAILGGSGHTMSNANHSAILAGGANTMTDVDDSAILGGFDNLIRGNGWYSCILGGMYNTVNEPNAIVGGYHAVASNSYTFVWADASSSSDFASTASHQFLIRALNGVGINTNNPSSALHVNGTITASAYRGDSSGIALITDHLRLGTLLDSGSNAPGYGKALIFSGAPDVSSTWNSDNSDPIWFARYNAGDDKSQLRLNIGDATSVDDKFVIGTTAGGDFNQGNSWTPKFSVDGSGTVRAAGTFIANTSPDLAETIPAADDVEAGDIVCADPTRREHAIRCAKGDRAILGVISDASGGFLINANGSSPNASLTGKPLVLTGRVPVKVSLENGPIKIGDTLTPSSIPGVAMRATQPGPAVGIALDEYSGSENGNEIGKVLCFVKVGDVNTATVLQQLNTDTTRLEKMLTDRDARIAALEKAVTALQQAIHSK